MQSTPSGLWAPLITPFKDGAVDYASYERLIDHFVACGVDGLFPLGTTGESPALDEAEIDQLVERTVARAGTVPVFVGVGGNATHKVTRALKRLERHRFAGIVSVCPYYNRPGQDGLIAHFKAIAAATDRAVMIYNIPYRTAVNLSNDSLLELAASAEHRGRQGQFRLDRPVARAAAAQARGLLGADRRGRAVLHHDGQWRRGRHPGGEPPDDPGLRRHRARVRTARPCRARERHGRRWRHSCRSCSPRPIRCRSNTACGGRA